MSIFGNSFKRELGKNTAKRVSNAIFGDKWSTPYKRLNSDTNPSASTQARLAHEATQREKIELKRRQLELEENRQQEKQALKRRQIAAEEGRNSINRAEAKKLENAQIWELDSAVIKNVDAVVAIEIPYEENGIEALALKLCNQLSTEQWCNVGRDGGKSKEGAIRDKFVNALTTKFNICLKQLIDRYPNNPSIPYLQEQKFLNEQKQRNAQLWPISNNDSLIAAIAIPTDAPSIEKLLDELQPHYKYTSNKVVQSKYLETLSALEKVNPDSPKISTAFKYHKKKVWGERWEDHKKTWLIMAGILLVIYAFGLMFQTLGVPVQQKLGTIVTSIIYIILIGIFILYPIGSWYIRKHRLDSYRKKLRQ